MRPNNVRQRWSENRPAVSAWLSMANPYGAEIAGHCGVDCVVVDLQHGMIDVTNMIAMMQALSATPAVPFVRVPSLDPPLLMKALDAGAYGIICPMISTVADAELFVAATSYPPRGQRSFGPARGLLYGGPDYFGEADRTIIRLAMIETEAGLANVEAICRVAGIDGIFVGPNDLGLALGAEPATDPNDAGVLAAITRCMDAAQAAGKHAGIFCASGVAARSRIREGFDFVVPNSDANLLRRVVTTEAEAARAAGV